MLHSWRERGQKMQEKEKERMQHMHAARLKLERKALVALPPCCIAERNPPKESDGDGWMGWGDPRYMAPPDLCPPRPLSSSHADAVTQAHSTGKLNIATDMHEYSHGHAYYLFAFVILVH